jgi:putative NADPH-quinone reductase
MKVLLVFAHPEPRSLHAALRDVAIRELEAQGHEVRLSETGSLKPIERTFLYWRRTRG